MIIFKEIKVRNSEHFIVFENEKGSKIEIPVDHIIAKQFGTYFERLNPPQIKAIERDNDPDSYV